MTQMNRYSFEIPYSEPCEIFARFADMNYSLFLDSADRAHPDARYSFIAVKPLEIIEAKDGLVTITNTTQQTSFITDPFEIVKQRLNHWGMSQTALPNLPPFQGGAAGIFGYDLGRGIEKLPSLAAKNSTMPDMAVGIYDTVMAFDHQLKSAWVITHAPNEIEAQEKKKYLASKTKENSISSQSHEFKWTSNFSARSYKEQVQKSIDYIHAGDVFQVNLSQRFEAETPHAFDAFAHYEYLRAINPAPFAAYMNMGNIKISSASPERFLTVRGQDVETKPIKGTRSRLSDPTRDQEQQTQLRHSEKDIAENIMIVDLLRNDLSKVCAPESITVEKLCALESFARVHHLVSTVRGKLENHTALDALKACFPGGSVTGAPKIRAMEIIEESEPTRRSPYCGALGYIGFDGTMDMNILIRTLVYQEGKVSFQTGGGITADSNPEAEYQETLDKAAGIFDSFHRHPGESRDLQGDNDNEIPASAGMTGVA